MSGAPPSRRRSCFTNRFQTPRAASQAAAPPKWRSESMSPWSRDESTEKTDRAPNAFCHHAVVPAANDRGGFHSDLSKAVCQKEFFLKAVLVGESILCDSLA